MAITHEAKGFPRRGGGPTFVKRVLCHSCCVSFRGFLPIVMSSLACSVPGYFWPINYQQVRETNAQMRTLKDQHERQRADYRVRHMYREAEREGDNVRIDVECAGDVESAGFRRVQNAAHLWEQLKVWRI